jgi:beta-glucosidase
MVSSQRIAATFEEEAVLTVASGNNMIMAAPQFYTGSLRALELNQMDMRDVDEAVRRVLTVKCKLGLFEDPRWPDIEKSKQRIGQPFSRSQAQIAAEESLVLLKNNGILPLNESRLRSIALELDNGILKRNTRETAQSQFWTASERDSMVKFVTTSVRPSKRMKRRWIRMSL